MDNKDKKGLVFYLILGFIVALIFFMLPIISVKIKEKNKEKRLGDFNNTPIENTDNTGDEGYSDEEYDKYFNDEDDTSLMLEDKNNIIAYYVKNFNFPILKKLLILTEMKNVLVEKGYSSAVTAIVDVENTYISDDLSSLHLAFYIKEAENLKFEYIYNFGSDSLMYKFIDDITLIQDNGDIKEDITIKE